MILVGLDPGLANFGACALMLPERLVVGADVWRSKPAKRGKVTEDRARRALGLTAWLNARLDEWGATAVAAEAPSGSQSAKAAAAMGLAWGAVVATLWARPHLNPFHVVSVERWRSTITGERHCPDARLYHVLRGMGGDVIATHLERRGISASHHDHALDALGVALWAARLPGASRAAEADAS